MAKGRDGIVLALTVASIAVSVLACQEQTDRPLAAGPGESGPGRILYLTYCQSCHGIGGRGDGNASASLRTPPADLTRLWERYGTPLERERLAEYIDGRQLFAAHGLREMPVWGNEFFEDAPPGSPTVELAKRRLIEVLADYIETLQTQRQF